MLLEIRHTFTVEMERTRVWETLWDVDAVTRCIPGCELVTKREAQNAYVAHVKKKIGPFALGMELEVLVVEITPPQLLRLEVKGVDRRLRSRVNQALSIVLTPTGERSTTIDILGPFTLEGALEGLNKHVISGQITQTLDEFTDALKSRVLANDSEASFETRFSNECDSKKTTMGS
jgi:carbon monoxide dehydrogenase subunit G